MNKYKKDNIINISEFKAKALAIIGEISKNGMEIIITKKGIPVARVIPMMTKEGFKRDSLKGLAETKGDIVHFDSSSEWEVLKK